VARTYLHGYGSGPWGASSTRRTRDWIMAQEQWRTMHPEVMDRLFTACNAAQDAGTDLGFGGGARSFSAQDAEFRRRHYVVPCPGLVFYDGKCWQRYSWAAPYAPPGRSWHEDDASTQGALAADLVGNHSWGTLNCARFGLRNGDQSEPWHYVPSEIPAGRPLDYTLPYLPPWGSTSTPPEAPEMATLRGGSVRILDTRTNGGKLAPGETRRVGVLQPPATWARAVIVDIGVSDTEGHGFTVAWSGEGDMPSTSVQDYPPGATYSNTWHIPISGSDLGGWGFSIFSLAGAHIVVELQGYDSVI
jgi:hypothetical protein